MKKTYLTLILLGMICYGEERNRGIQFIEKEIMETLVIKEENKMEETIIEEKKDDEKNNKTKEEYDIKNVVILKEDNILNKEEQNIEKTIIEENQRNKEKKFIFVKTEKKDIKIDIENLKKEIEILNKDIEKIKEETKNIKEDIKKEEIIAQKAIKKEEVKEEKIIKKEIISEKEFLGMKVGEWEIEKEELKKWIGKEKREYIVIPIIDKKEYINDRKELKKYGLSRKRAETGIKIIKEMNEENEVYIGKEIEIKENQRGIKIKIKE